jgi:hypothetical protein
MARARKLIFPFFMLLVVAVVVYADVISDPPKARYKGGSIVVEWTTNDESGVKKFDVLRAQVKGPEHGEFVSLASVDPKGNHSNYVYVDQSAFKTTDNLFVYKIRVTFQDGTFSDSADSPPALMSSAAKRTWGSIKAMFR